MTWPLKPLGVGGILDQSLRFYRRSFVQLFLLTLMLLGGSYLVIFGGVFGFALMAGDGAGDPKSLGALGALVIIFVYVGLFLVLHAAIITLVKESVLGEKPGLKQVIRESSKRFWPLFGRSLLFGLGLCAVAVLITIVLGSITAGATSTMRTDNMVNTILIVVIGVLVGAALYLGIMYLFIRSSFFFPIVLEGGEAPFQNSWRLSKGSFWRLLAVFIVVYAIYFIIIYGCQLLATLLPGVFLIFGMILYILITFALLPLPIIAFTLCYFDLKVRTEGSDLQDMINVTLTRTEEGAGPAPEINMEG